MAEPNRQLDSPAADIAPLAELGDEAQRVLRPGSNAAAFVRDLAKAGLFPEAVRVLAHALAGRECIAWSLACVGELKPSSPNQEPALTAVEAWLAEPSDANRRAAHEAGTLARASTPAGCLALAVFLTGSIAPAGASEVPPPPRVAEKIAAGGIMLAVVSQPEKAAERYQRCLEAGLQRK